MKAPATTPKQPPFAAKSAVHNGQAFKNTRYRNMASYCCTVPQLVTTLLLQPKPSKSSLYNGSFPCFSARLEGGSNPPCYRVRPAGRSCWLGGCRTSSASSGLFFAKESRRCKYSATKRFARLILVLSYCLVSVPSIVLRPYAVVGPNLTKGLRRAASSTAPPKSCKQTLIRGGRGGQRNLACDISRLQGVFSSALRAESAAVAVRILYHIPAGVSVSASTHHEDPPISLPASSCGETKKTAPGRSFHPCWVWEAASAKQSCGGFQSIAFL